MSIKELDEASQTYKKLLESMEKVDKKYSTSYNEPESGAYEDLGLTKIEYAMPTEQEISNLAEQYFAANKTSDVANIKNNIETDINSLSGKTKNVLAQALQGQLEVERQRKSGLRSANYTAQAKNLSDSSIKTGLEDRVNVSADTELSDIETEKNNDIRSIEEQIEYLQKLRDQKLADIEEIYNKRVAEKTSELQKDAQEEKEAADKYNNTVEEKERKYKQSLEKEQAKREQEEWKRLADMLELTNKIGESGVEKQKQQEKYRAVREILDQLSPDEAIQLLTGSSAFKIHLGDMYDSLLAYYKLLKEKQ